MTWVTGSTGSPGHMVLGSLGRWVTKCDPVPCLRPTLSVACDRVSGVWRFKPTIKIVCF